MLIKKANNKQLVTRYNLSIVVIFVGIILVALVVALVLYDKNLAELEDNNYQQLVQQANKIDVQLLQSMQGVTSLRDFADYYLNYASELKVLSPKLVQNGEKFHLQKSAQNLVARSPHLSANITGIGDISTMSASLNKELSMAIGLTPALITAKNSSQVTDWFYYISLNRFVSLYPWIGHRNWQYLDLVLNNPFIIGIIDSSDHGDSFFWSIPYFETAGEDLITQVAKKVMSKGKMLGAVVANINLARLHNSLSTVTEVDQGYFLIDSKDRLYIHKDISSETIKTNMFWQQIAPEGLQHLTYQTLQKQNNTLNVNGWTLQKHPLSVNNWLLIKYQASSDFSNQVYQRYFELFLIVFVNALTLLIIIYFVTRNTFIRPTQEFISHIENSARGDHGMVTPPQGWQHWFHIVEDIFSQNRSFFQQLKDQNMVLDARVNEKTLALSLKSIQHQHDYAILRSVMNAIPDFLIFNDQHGKLIGCNLAFEKLVGQQEMAMFGSFAGEFLNNELGQALLNLSQKHTVKSATHGVCQVIHTVSNTYELFSTNFINHEQQILGTIDFIRDVTQQYADNAALAAAADQAESASQAKSQFLANMSHEIRTPINAIQGMYQLLEKSELSNQQRSHLDNAQLASVSLLHLVDELLDLSKIEAGKLSIFKEQCSLDQIVKQAAKLNIAAAHQKGLEFKIHIDHDVSEFIVSDKIRLMQVLTNLLNNAVKFTEQGEINLMIMLSESDNQHADRSLQSVLFVVKDTGIGIAKDKQEYLFDVFVQADESMTRSYGGSGLGLSICQKIIRLLGGEIILQSEKNQGCTFSFELTFELATKTNPPLAQDNKIIRFCSVNNSLPSELSKEIKAFGYDYLNLTDNNPVLPNELYHKTLMLIEVEQLNQEFFSSLQERFTQCSPVSAAANYLVIYQKNLLNKQAKNIQLLDNQDIPYVIFEPPYYRHSVTELLSRCDDRQLCWFGTEPNQGIDKPQIDRSEEKNLSGVRILLVEDNLVNQLVAKELLLALKAEVVISENGQQALDVLKDEVFDVVLMDIQMPVMDGLSAAKKLRSDYRYDTLPIIAMTAHAREEDKENSAAVGMNLHIAKPVQSEVLLNSILKVVNKDIRK